MSPRRRHLTRTLATWSFALLVIGAAIVDSTILAKEPTRQHANVDVKAEADVPPPATIETSSGDPCEAELGSVDPVVAEHLRRVAATVRETERVAAECAGRIMVLDADAPRPQNRIDIVDHSSSPRLVTLTHTATEGGMPVELRAPAGCTIHIGGTQSAKAPLRVVLPDGRYIVWSSCGKGVTALNVRLDRAGSPRSAHVVDPFQRLGR